MKKVSISLILSILFFNYSFSQSDSLPKFNNSISIFKGVFNTTFRTEVKRKKLSIISGFGVFNQGIELNTQTVFFDGSESQMRDGFFYHETNFPLINVDGGIKFYFNTNNTTVNQYLKSSIKLFYVKDNFFSDDSYRYLINKNNFSMIGFDLGYGIVSNISKNISVSLEYELNFVYTNYEQSYKSTYFDEKSLKYYDANTVLYTNQWRSFGNVNLGLSFNF